MEKPIEFHTEVDRLRFFVAGIASLKLGAPKGVRCDVHQGRLLREIRNAARLLLEKPDGR